MERNCQLTDQIWTHLKAEVRNFFLKSQYFVVFMERSCKVADKVWTSNEKSLIFATDGVQIKES